MKKLIKIGAEPRNPIYRTRHAHLAVEKVFPAKFGLKFFQRNYFPDHKQGEQSDKKALTDKQQFDA